MEQFLLTDAMIHNSFEKTGIDMKYFAVYSRTGDRSLSRKIINRSSLIHNRKQCQDEDAYNPARESIMS